MEGGRGTGQCLFLIWQLMGSWFCSNSFGSFVSYNHKTLPIEQQFCSSSGAYLPWEGPAGARSNHRAKDRKSDIYLGLFSGETCSGQFGGTGPLRSMPHAQLGDLQHQLRRTVLTSPGAGKAEPTLITPGVIPRPAPDEWEHFFPPTAMCCRRTS